MKKSVTVAEAARALRKSPATVRRYVQAGAPCVSPGEVGRGKGALIDIDALQQWLANRAAPGLASSAQSIQLEQIAESLWRVLRNDRAAEKLALSERQAAGLLLLAYERLAKDLTREPVDIEELPARMNQLCAIWVGCADKQPRLFSLEGRRL